MAGVPLEIVLTRLAGGPQLRRDELKLLSSEDWRALDVRAGEHRLRPLLHYRWQSHSAVPKALREVWAEARRAAALDALDQRRTLIGLVNRLAAAGLPAIALKGSWLAWHAYPEPALRPLRDIDLLLVEADALAARELLLADGWTEARSSAMPAAEWLARFKHLPELLSPEGHLLDLHARLWDDDGRAPPQPPGLWERAVHDPELPALRFLAPEDLLMHLAIHATQHRFDGGPLMLADFDRLLARVAFDWPKIAERAAAEGWDRALTVAMAAVRQWGSQGLWRGPEVDAPPNLIEDIPFLVAKPLRARAEDIGALKRGRSDIGWRDKLRRIWARRHRYASFGSWIGWVARETKLALQARGNRLQAARAARGARLDAYLRER